MKLLLIGSAALLVMSAAAFGNDLSITFTPSSESYPPGYDPAQCQLNGTARCVVFFGTLTDTDTDGSFLFLNSIAISAYTNYFTVDNVFSNDVPGGFEGDLDSAPFPNSYTGPIFGLDIAPMTPVGAYSALAEITGFGGTNDPNNNGFTVQASFTVIVAPEPLTGAMSLAAGLFALAGSCLYRHRTRGGSGIPLVSSAESSNRAKWGSNSIA